MSLSFLDLLCKVVKLLVLTSKCLVLFHVLPHLALEKYPRHGEWGKEEDRETELFRLEKGDVNSEQFVKSAGKINTKSDSSAQGISIFWKL